jgi:hypothetical protein
MNNKDKWLDALRAALKDTDFPHVIQRYCAIYEETEHRLASGLEVSLQDRAEHERIKCRIQEGYSLRDAMIRWHVEMYLAMWDRDHPGMPKPGPEFKENLFRIFATCAAEVC